MANDENINNEIEPEAGFQPDLESDDTFALEKMDEYPGELPNIGYEEPAPEAFTSQTQDVAGVTSEIVDKEVNEPTNESSRIKLMEESDEKTDYTKSGLVEDETSDTSSSLNEAEIIEPPASGTVWDLFDKEEEEITSNTNEALESTQPIESTPSIEAPVKEINNESEYKASDVNIKSGEEAITIDEDLRNLIQGDLAKNRTKSEDRTVQEPDGIGEQTISEKKEVLEISELEEGEANVIDIGSMDADKPSTYGLETSVMEEVAEGQLDEGMHMAMPKRKPAVNPDETGEIKERRKIMFPWKPIAIAAAAVLILSAGMLGIYKLFFEKNFTQKQPTQELYTAKNQKPLRKVAPKEIVPVPKEKKDTTQLIAAKDTDINISDIKPAIVPKVEKYKPRFQFIEPQKEKTERKIVIKEEVKPPPIMVAEIPPVQKDAKPEPVKPVEPDKVFVVQIYSTPSKDDAEEWLARLRNKNIQNAFISNQKIRDKIWYRVRFGNFNSREEAMSEALKYGFPQSWIDRVK